MAYLLAAWIFGWLGMAVVARSIVNRLPFLPESRSTESPDSVSVIIPARNEEESIERTVRSILAQTHRGVDLIVVNDHSTDSTGVILDRISANEQRLQVIHDPALQPGWLGKPNALDRGTRLATGKWLIFADADIVFTPDAIDRAVSVADSEDLAGLSLIPKLITISWSECAIVPLIPLGSIALRPDSANSNQPGGGFATGAFIMLQRKAYDSIGGHESVKAEIIDDIALGKRAKASGLRFRLFRGEDVASVRMYTGARSLLFGLVKNVSFVIGGPRGNPIRAPVAALVTAVVMNVPLLALVAGAVTGRSYVWLALGAYLMPVVMTLKMRHSVDVRIRYVFLYPAAGWIVFAATLIATYYRLARGTVRWRGREIKLGG